MAARGLNVFVNIGAKVASSVGSAASSVERRFASMGRALKVQAAELKATTRSMQSAYADAAGIVAGAGAAKLFRTSVDEGAEYKHQLTLLENAGRTRLEVAQAIAAANKAIAVAPSTTLSDNLKVLNETTLAYGSLGHAIDNLNFNAKMGAMLKNVMGDHAGDTGEMFNQLVRALELRSGKMSTADYQRQANKLFKAFEVSGGTVNPENFLGFSQQAAVAMRGYSEDYLTKVVPSLIQEFGGERAGTVSTALYNQFMGRVPVGGKKLTQEWVRLGLVPPNGSAGNLSTTGWAPESLKGYKLAQTNPLEWVEKVMLPAMAAHGVNTNDPQALLMQAQKMFGRETGKRLASTLLDPAQRARIHADMALYDKARGVDAAFTNAMANDPKMAIASAASSLKHLETNLGKAVTPQVITALQNFARGINFLAGVVDAHPMLGKLIMGLFAGIAGLAALRIGKIALDFLGIGRAFGFLTSGVGKLGPKIPYLTRIGNALRILIGEGLIPALASLGSMVVEGVAAAFALLSNPIGWAVLAGLVIGGLIFAFRHHIAAGMTKVAAWFRDAFHKLADVARGVDWAGVGMAIADSLTFGLASKLPALLDTAKRIAERVVHPGPKAAAPKTRGARAGGGSVSGGSWYRINEQGQEFFAPGVSGSVIPARVSAALLALASGAMPAAAATAPAPTINGATIIIQDARDPEATAREVERALYRIARQQTSLYSD